MLKIAGRVSNRIDLDQTPRFVVSDLGLHCCEEMPFAKTYGIYGNKIILIKI